MNIGHSESTPWQEPSRVRGGTILFKRLLEGAEGTPNNFSLVLADTDVSFKSPRHRHNFDQIRITVEGSTNVGVKRNIELGEVAYFPEGTHYGPQDQESVGQRSIAMVIQFGGASGLGYMSYRQLHEGHEKLQAFGRFEGGVFRRDAPAADGRINQDAYEAIWENEHGRPVEYPKPRFVEPVHFREKNFDWKPVAGRPGVALKHLGAFGDRGVAISCLRLEPGAEHVLDAGGQERIAFVREGEGRFADGGHWARHSAFHLAEGEAATLRATTASDLLLLALPRF